MNLNNASGALDIFTREVRGAANAGVAMAGELLNANQSLSAYTSALDTNSGLLGNFGKVINGLTKFAEESLAEYQTLSGIGATFGKEMSNIRIAAANLGLSVKDMTDLFMRNSDGLRTFGGTTDVAISSFTRFSRAVLDSQAGTELRRLGYTAADINETLMVYNELAQQDGLNRTRSTEQQVSSARDFAVELDGLAKLTGKQRKELADDMRARRREGDVQAFLMGQSAEAQEAFMLATQEIKETMGPQFEALFQDLLIRGAPITEDTRNAFIALGGSADEFEATVANFRRGMDTGNFDAFNDSITDAQGAFLENLQTDEARTMAMQSGLSGVADAMADAYNSSYNFANAVDASAEEQESATETIQRLQTQISEEQFTQMQTTGNLLDKTVQMQESLREFTIAATTEVLPRLEAMAVRGIDMFLERLPSADQIAAQLAGGVDQLFDNLDERIGNPYNNPTMGTEWWNSPTEGDYYLGEEFGAAADSMGADLDESAEETREAAAAEIESAQTALETAQAESDAAREAAEAALSEAQAELAALTNDGFHGSIEAIDAAQQRVDAAEETLSQSIERGNTAILNAMSNLNRAQALARNNLPTTAAGTPDWRYTRRAAKGAKLDPNEVALVGESGAEFVAGPGEVMSAKESTNVLSQLIGTLDTLPTSIANASNDNTQSFINEIESLPRILASASDNNTQSFMSEIQALPTSLSTAFEGTSVIQNLLNSIDNLDTNVKTQTEMQTTSNTVSNNNRNENLEKKYDTMIGLLSQLLNVEVNASSTAQRTYRATKGLQGNMIRGLGV